MIAILGALGSVMMPLADFCGGQIYKAGEVAFVYSSVRIIFYISGGFLAVYSTSLGFTFLGILYIWLIPESVTRRSHVEVEFDPNNNEETKRIGVCQRLINFICDTNKLFIDTIRFVFR